MLLLEKDTVGWSRSLPRGATGGSDGGGCLGSDAERERLDAPDAGVVGTVADA